MRVRPLSPSAAELYRRWRARVEPSERASLRWQRGVVIVWLVLAVAVSVRTVVRPSSHTVFPIFAASAQHWWDDQSLYQQYPSLDNFRYPPLFALFVTPFASLGLTAGGILWSWVSLSVFALGMWRFVRDVIPCVWSTQRMALFFLLGGLGALRGLWNAQSNALIVGLLLLGVAALTNAVAKQEQKDSDRAWWWAVVLLAIPICLKLTPVVPVLLLVTLWPRQLAGRLALVILGLFLLPFLTRPPEIVLDHYREWIDHLTESGNIRWLGFRDGWTVWLVLRHLLGEEAGVLCLNEPMDSLGYRLVQLATGAAVLGWCLWQQRRARQYGLGPRWSVHVTLSMGLAWLMLFGPAVEHATYVFLTPPLVWALLEQRSWPMGRGLILAAFALIMVLGWGAVTRLLSPDWPVLLTTLPAGTALFSLWLIGYARACGESAAHAPTNLSEIQTDTLKRWPSCRGWKDESRIPS